MSKQITTRIEFLTARIEKDQAELADLQAKSAALTADLTPGAVVQFHYGRKEKLVLSGTVLGVAKPEGKGPTIVKVLTGEGANSSILSIYPTDVIVQAAEDEVIG